MMISQDTFPAFSHFLTFSQHPPVTPLLKVQRCNVASWQRVSHININTSVKSLYLIEGPLVSWVFRRGWKYIHRVAGVTRILNMDGKDLGSETRKFSLFHEILSVVRRWFSHFSQLMHCSTNSILIRESSLAWSVKYVKMPRKTF